MRLRNRLYFLYRRFFCKIFVAVKHDDGNGDGKGYAAVWPVRGAFGNLPRQGQKQYGAIYNASTLAALQEQYGTVTPINPERGKSNITQRAI